MPDDMNIGLIGLDTSHVERFLEVLNDAEDPNYAAGARIVMGYPGGSEDFELSIGRVEEYTKMLRDDFEARIVDSPEEVAESCDAVIMTAVDGRVHRTLFERIASAKKPTFIDKPFTVSAEDAEAIVQTASDHATPVFSASSLRFEEDLVRALADDEKGAVTGAAFFGPMDIQPTQPGLFWYGIHTVNMLYASLGAGCRQVSATTTENHDVVVGEWEDGRIGTVRGNRAGNFNFGGTLHREQGSRPIVTAGPADRPKHACLMERILDFFRTGEPPVDNRETLETIRFIEAANESRETGERVRI